MIDDETLLKIAINETYKKIAVRGSSKNLVIPTYIYALKLYSWFKQLDKNSFNLPKDRIKMNLIRSNNFDKL